MNIYFIKIHMTFIIIAVCLGCESIEGAEPETRESQTLHGVIESVDGNNITVTYRRESRTFTLHDKTTIRYVSFLKAKKEIKPGFYFRAGIDPKGQCHQLWVTLPIPEKQIKPSAKMLTMTPAELHEMADSDGDGEVSYVEYANAIYRSPKHGPIQFLKADKDKSGTLNLEEFTPRLESAKWWRYSRKTPAKWHAQADADANGVLSKQEFATVIGTTAHLDTRFKQADKDRSDDITVEEVAGFIDAILR
jgi:Ca2+-binding EF-hand superfamily protein